MYLLCTILLWRVLYHYDVSYSVMTCSLSRGAFDHNFSVIPLFQSTAENLRRESSDHARRSGRKSPSFWPRIRRGVSQLGSGAGDPWYEARCAGIGRKDVLRSRVCCGHDLVCSARLSSWCPDLWFFLSVLQAEKYWIKTKGAESGCVCVCVCVCACVRVCVRACVRVSVSLSLSLSLSDSDFIWFSDCALLEGKQKDKVSYLY